MRRIYKKFIILFVFCSLICNFAPGFQAQMAESVDALVSNTSGATHPGSSPGLGTRLEKQSVLQGRKDMRHAFFFRLWK